jgi:NADPH:quinone reductase-like Zn-dependent oxidoreductase
LERRNALFAPSFALPGLHISGTYTQYMEVPAYAVVKDETGLKPEEVATLPVVLATAVHAVKEVGQVKRGDKVWPAISKICNMACNWLRRGE